LYLERLDSYLSRGVFAKEKGATHQELLGLIEYVASIGRSHYSVHKWRVGDVENVLEKPCSAWRDLKVHCETVRMAVVDGICAETKDGDGRRQFDEVIQESVAVVHKVLKWLRQGVEALGVFQATKAVPLDLDV
jgi:hypothetical protein